MALVDFMTGLALFPAMTGTVSVLCGIAGYRQLTLANATLHWPLVEGRITHSRVDRGLLGSNRDYFADIRYTYRVAEREHEGRILSHGTGFQSGSEDLATSLSEQYPVGQEVAVFVNPTRREESVLERGHFSPAHSNLAMAAAFALLTVILGYAVLA
jgi:hypothetical protein